MAQDMSGKEPPLPCNTSARIRNLSEEDAWRARQVLASSKKRLQRSSSNGGLAEGSSPPAGLSVCSRPLSAGNDIGIGVVTETFRGAAACHSKSHASSPDEKWAIPEEPGRIHGNARAGVNRGYESDSDVGDARTLNNESLEYTASVRSSTPMRAQVGDPSPSLKGTALVRNRSSPRSRPIENEARYDHNHEFHLDDDLRVLTHALREEFELKIVGTAREALRSAVNKAQREGRQRLAEQRAESAREFRCLQEEAAGLRAEMANLQGVKAALVHKVAVCGERLSVQHLRIARGSLLARCMDGWRRCASEGHRERCKIILAVSHAKKALMVRVLNAWRGETRRRLNSRGLRAADMKLEAISKEIIGRYEAELANTRTALEEAHRQITLEKLRQREMEEGMRRTLLRGMSAMNMEAMYVLNGASECDHRCEVSRSGVGGGDGRKRSGSGGGGGGGGGGFSAGRTVASVSSGVPSMTGRLRASDECPRPLEPPKPAILPSSR